jgi:hypothetical protein
MAVAGDPGLALAEGVSACAAGPAVAGVVDAASDAGEAPAGGASAVWLSRGAVGQVLVAGVTGEVAVVPDGALLAAGSGTGRVAADACGPSAITRAAVALGAVVGAGRAAGGDACAAPLAADCGVAA